MKHLVILESKHGLDNKQQASPIIDGVSIPKASITRNIVEKVYTILEYYPDIEVFLTNTEKYDVDNVDRKGRINLAVSAFTKKCGIEGKRLFIGVDLAGNPKEWVQAKNALVKYGAEKDKSFAKTMDKSLHLYLKRRKEESMIPDGIMLGANVDSAITCDCGVINNRDNLSKLSTKGFQNRCAEAIVNGLLEFLDIEKIHPLTIDKDPADEVPNEELSPETTTIFNLLPNGTRVVKIDPTKLSVVANIGSIKDTTIPNCINGPLSHEGELGFMYDGIFILNGEIKSEKAINFDLFGTSQGVFIIRNNGKAEVRRAKKASDIPNIDTIRLGISGTTIARREDTKYKFNPAIEGFKVGKNSDGKEVDNTALLKGPKTVLGYNKKDNQLIILCNEEIELVDTSVTLDKLALDLGCDVAIALLTESFMRFEDKFVFNAKDPEAQMHTVLSFE